MPQDVLAPDVDTSTVLSMRRTGMSFQRTRMSADRTLMSVIRTSISLISFGFTISQFFSKLKQADMLKGAQDAPKSFGLALVWLGIGMLVLGIVYQLQFMVGLRKLRTEMKSEGLIYGESHFPTSMTLLVAIALLVVGILAMLSIQLDVGPFG
jgi:putative membrane protein